MTRKQRVADAISHREPDRVPWQIELVSELQERVESRLGLPKGGFSGWAGNHVLKADGDKGAVTAPGFFTDEYGVVWNRTIDKDIGNIENIMIPEPDIRCYTPPPLDLEFTKARTQNMLDKGKDMFCVFKIGSVLFERAWFLRGFENLMTDFYSNPGFVHALMEALTERSEAMIRAAMALEPDGLYLGDDYGTQAGMMLSPACWRTYVRPYLQRLMDPALEKGKPVLLHSCGNITPILPDLTDMGLSVYQTVQPEVYDLVKLKREYGKHLSFFGGIGTQSDLPHATPEGLRRVVRETCRILGEGGGYICGPTHKATADTPVENVIAMAETLRD
jgi:uroporphyrinogen decarboxylase